MRSAVIISALAALAAAAPRPQDIDFTQVDAAGAAEVESAPAAATAASQVVAVPSQTGLAASVVSATPLAQRDFDDLISALSKRDGNCAAQPAGTGPTINK
jgi:hypothetical protein